MRSQYVSMLLPGIALKKGAACLASRDPNQASCPRSQSVNASKIVNKRQEDVLGLVYQLLGNANPWESFTWTMKHLKQAVFALTSSAIKVVRSRKALRPRSLLQPLPHLRHHQDCQLYSWRLLVGRSPWLPLETTLDTSDTTQETTRRQLQVKCYRSTHYAKGTTIVAIAPG